MRLRHDTCLFLNDHCVTDGIEETRSEVYRNQEGGSAEEDRCKEDCTQEGSR